MKTLRWMIGSAVLIAAVAVILNQRLQIIRLRAELEVSEKRSAEFSSARDKFLAGNRLRDELIERLREEGREVHRLRGTLTGLARTNREPIGSIPKLSLSASGGLGGTVSSNGFTFAGFGSPENGVRSFLWATAQGQYEDWFAALGSTGQAEELAKTDGDQEFRANQTGPKTIRGMQILASKPIGSGRTELKVRMDFESSSEVFIFPMEEIGNEWKLGGDLRAYTDVWDLPNVGKP